MNRVSLALLVVMVSATLGSCRQDAVNELPSPGASWTTQRLTGASFVKPAPVMSRVRELDFWTGFALFRDPWVASPSSTTARDGLGPLFSARSCLACHEDAGRGDSLLKNAQTFSTVYRIADHSELREVFGTHLQPRATFDDMQRGTRLTGFFEGEPRPYVEIRQVPVPESSYVLKQIHVALGDELVAPRIAPGIVGLGLLEAIPSARLEQLDDPDDRDRDGISGRVNWVDTNAGEVMPGRFGWKASQATVAIQTADAFRNDIGITSALEPEENCERNQATCLQQSSGAGPRGDHEINAPLFDHVVTFTASLAVPEARELTAERRLGKRLFAGAGCDACHVPSHTVNVGGNEETIWPYTDLLLHDMGPMLADGVVEGSASGSEWRTPPLWSLGIALELNPDSGLLHDGRATNVHEAILWHGGEGARAAAQFLELSEAEQDALASFVLAL